MQHQTSAPNTSEVSAHMLGYGYSGQVAFVSIAKLLG